MEGVYRLMAELTDGSGLRQMVSIPRISGRFRGSVSLFSSSRGDRGLAWDRLPQVVLRAVICGFEWRGARGSAGNPAGGAARGGTSRPQGQGGDPDTGDL